MSLVLFLCLPWLLHSRKCHVAFIYSKRLNCFLLYFIRSTSFEAITWWRTCSKQFLFFLLSLTEDIKSWNWDKTLFCCMVLGETSCASRAELWKSVTFLFSEKATICLNVSVPWVTWMPEASGRTAFRRITLLVLMIEAQCLQVEWCLEQTNHSSNATDVHWRGTFFYSIHSLQRIYLEKHILKLLNSTCLSIWNTYREFSMSETDRS